MVCARAHERAHASLYKLLHAHGIIYFLSLSSLFFFFFFPTSFFLFSEFNRGISKIIKRDQHAVVVIVIQVDQDVYFVVV